MRVGEILRAWREGKHMGVREAAREVGTSSATYSRLENGKPVDGRTMVKIIKFLFE